MPPQPPPAPVADEARAQHEEILLRFPPDDPGRLFRASLVCKAWRSLLTSPVFARRYRELHRTPPLLGFFENHDGTVGTWFEPSSPTSPFLPMHPDHRREFFVLDCRHGLVLLRTPVSKSEEPAQRLVVWDPIGRRQWEFPPPEFAAHIIYDNAVVLCDADGCDHLACHGGGRFLVVYVGTNYSVAHASVFSSETSAWSAVASFHPPQPNLEIASAPPKALVGNVVYFNGYTTDDTMIILRFDYSSRELSMIRGPDNAPAFGSALKKTEKDRQDGQDRQDVLGCANMDESGLRLWSMDAVPDGSVAWTQDIELEMPRNIFSSPFDFNVIGFADGIDVLYLRTAAGIFTVDLKSGGVKNIGPVRNFRAIPYMSFYTPDQASGQVGDEDGGGWEEVGNGEKDEEQQEDEAAQELFSNGSEAFENGDFVSAVDCLRRSLKIRVVHHGKLSPRCRDTYYRYGWALLRKAQASNENSTWQYHFDLDLAWKMLHVARVILQKSPDSTREKVKIFAALAKVSMQREDRDHSFIACFKALDFLANLVDQPHLRFIINLNIRICFPFEFPASGDATANLLCRSHLQKLKMVNVALLVDNAESPRANDIQFVTNILLSALEEKLEDLETSSQFSGSSNTTSTAAGIAEDSPSAESDTSNSTDG